MKLAKALKLKNKKIREYNEVVSRMIRSNSYDVDSNKIYNAAELLVEAEAKLNDLVAFKAAIHSTSEPIRATIFKLGEIKSFLSTFSNMNTREGIVKESGYREQSVTTYAADINEIAKTTHVKLLQDTIETLQEEIDTFNATTELVGYEG
jgi:hypothetical protein